MQHQSVLLSREEITDNVILIKINKFYRPGMGEQEKYEYTRGIWKLDPEKAGHAQYVLAVYFGEIIEVYVPNHWQKAGETPYQIREDLKDGVPPIDRNGSLTSGRYEFEGCVAPEPARSRYRGKSAKALYKKGEANPVKYIYPNSEAKPAKVKTESVSASRYERETGHRTGRSVNPQLRYKVLKRDNYKCCACGASPAKDPSVELQIDHIVPWSKGGETELENLQTLCSICNLGKSNL